MHLSAIRCETRIPGRPPRSPTKPVWCLRGPPQVGSGAARDGELATKIEHLKGDRAARGGGGLPRRKLTWAPRPRFGDDAGPARCFEARPPCPVVFRFGRGLGCGVASGNLRQRGSTSRAERVQYRWALRSTSFGNNVPSHHHHHHQYYFR